MGSSSFWFLRRDTIVAALGVLFLFGFGTKIIFFLAPVADWPVCSDDELDELMDAELDFPSS
jgi:hypothetical protein